MDLGEYGPQPILVLFLSLELGLPDLFVLALQQVQLVFEACQRVEVLGDLSVQPRQLSLLDFFLEHLEAYDLVDFGLLEYLLVVGGEGLLHALVVLAAQLAELYPYLRPCVVDLL